MSTIIIRTLGQTLILSSCLIFFGASSLRADIDASAKTDQVVKPAMVNRVVIGTKADSEGMYPFIRSTINETSGRVIFLSCLGYFEGETGPVAQQGPSTRTLVMKRCSALGSNEGYDRQELVDHLLTEAAKRQITERQTLLPAIALGTTVGAYLGSSLFGKVFDLFPAMRAAISGAKTGVSWAIVTATGAVAGGVAGGKILKYATGADQARLAYWLGRDAAGFIKRGSAYPADTVEVEVVEIEDIDMPKAISSLSKALLSYSPGSMPGSN